MRHRLQKRSSFGLKSGPRQALIRGLVSSLVEHERIKTTLPKAREAKKSVERAITKAKAGDLSSRRNLISLFPYNKKTVSKIMDSLSTRFKERKGGYTRIVKLGKRIGDSAEMAFLEFVDYDPLKKSVQKPDQKTKEKLKKTDQKTVEKHEKKNSFKALKKKKKHLRKMKSQSRRRNRV